MRAGVVVVIVVIFCFSSCLLSDREVLERHRSTVVDGTGSLCVHIAAAAAAAVAAIALATAAVATTAAVAVAAVAAAALAVVKW